MIPKRIEDITCEDIQLVVDNAVQESKTIEYKVELPHEGDSKKIPFLAEVSAFANTTGGDLIFGVKEAQGIPVDLPGLQVDNVDKEILRLETIIQNGIEPRLTDVASKAIEMPSGSCIIMVRIGRSWNAPHRVSYKDHAKFYGRNSAGKYPLDVSELRAAFLYSEVIPERIHRFREDRITALFTGKDVPVPLASGGIMALHIIPLSAFTTHKSNLIAPKSENAQYLPPIGATGWNNKINVDGILTYDSRDNGARYYAQTFRSGIVETAVVLQPYDDESLSLPSIWYENQIIMCCRQYMANLARFDIQPPIYLLLSFVNMKDFELGTGSMFFKSGQLDRELFMFPEVIVESSTEEMVSVLRPVFDMVWNSFGYERSLNYSENGEWKG